MSGDCVFHVLQGEGSSAPHLTERRLERARHLVLYGRLPLQRIAHQCGFADHSHLTRLFKRRFGVAPSTMRGRT